MNLRQMALHGLILLWGVVLTAGGATTAALQALGPLPVAPEPSPIPVVAASLVPIRSAPPAPLALPTPHLPVPPLPPREARQAAPHPRAFAQTRPPLREPETYYEPEMPAAYAEGWGNMRMNRPQYDMGYYSYYYPRY